MHTLCLVKRWKHHTDSGGYDRLASAVGADEIWRSNLNGILPRLIKKMWNRQSRTGSYLLDYRFEDWVAEQRVFARCLIRPPDLVHVLYGDEQLDLLLRWRRLLRCPLVATFHLPAERVTQRFECFHKKEIKGLDAAIVLARSELPAFRKWFGVNKAVYVPHGIDTGKFRPTERSSTNKNLNLLVVGDHMRDWELIHRVIDESFNERLAIDFDVVTKPEFFAHFTGCSSVRLHSRLPESRLVELYQSADALFVPVTQATANNSILEALACGTPVISTRVGGIPDYVATDCGWLTSPGSVAPVVELLRELSAHREVVRARRGPSRDQALKFDWRRIGERVSAVYSAVSSGQSLSSADFV